MKRRKKLWIFLIVMIFSICFVGCERLEVFGKTQMQQLDTREELCDYIQTCLQKGEKEIQALVSTKITEEEFKNLNQYLDGYYGRIERYSYRNSLRRGYYNVSMETAISDNYYAEQVVLKKINPKKVTKRAAELAETAKKIVKKIIEKDMTDYEKEKEIHDYIISHAKWEFLEGEEQEQSYHAYGVLVKGKGVCQGYAEAMQLLSNLSGVESQIITGVAGGENHAWNLIKLGKSWYQLDITWDDPVPDEEGRVLYSYFNVNDEILKRSHKWDKKLYPEANGKKYNYFRQEGIYFETKKEAEKYMLEKIKKNSPKRMDIMVGDYNKKKYGEKWAQFVYQAEQVKSVSYEMYGEAPNVCFAFYFTY